MKAPVRIEVRPHFREMGLIAFHRRFPLIPAPAPRPRGYAVTAVTPPFSSTVKGSSSPAEGSRKSVRSPEGTAAVHCRSIQRPSVAATTHRTPLRHHREGNHEIIATSGDLAMKKGQTLPDLAPLFFQQTGSDPISSADADRQEQPRAFTLEQDGHGLRTAGRGVLELGDGLHFLAIHAEDDVAGAHARLRGWPFDVFDQ